MTLNEVNVEFKIIDINKKQYLDLLLLADESEQMIDKYLERGEMFAYHHGQECGIVTSLS